MAYSSIVGMVVNLPKAHPKSVDTRFRLGQSHLSFKDTGAAAQTREKAA